MRHTRWHSSPHDVTRTALISHRRTVRHERGTARCCCCCSCESRFFVIRVQRTARRQRGHDDIQAQELHYWQDSVARPAKRCLPTKNKPPSSVAILRHIHEQLQSYRHATVLPPVSTYSTVSLLPRYIAPVMAVLRMSPRARQQYETRCLLALPSTCCTAARVHDCKTARLHSTHGAGRTNRPHPSYLAQ
jgi:hypothetical protein